MAHAQSQLKIRNESWGAFTNPTVTVESVATGGWAWTDGIISTSRGGFGNHGVKGFAFGGTNYNVGVYGQADSAGITGLGMLAISSNGRSSNYGIYADAFGGGHQNWAGYFVGNVFTTGSYLPSDEKLKRNIRTEESALQKIMQLRPVSYEYKTEEFKAMRLPENTQHGFVAQEVQKIFPEAVREVHQPIFEKGALTRTEEFTAVNYQSLIPILFKAIQEQQAQIETLQKELNELKGRKITKAAFMSDAIPNPANVSTTIKYSVPESVQKASIVVYDGTGKKILQFNNLKGNSQVVINSSELAAGTYVYTMLVGGKPVLTNKFLVGKG
jgi:hypothetical protein